MSTPETSAVATSSTVICSPRNGSVVPAERDDAKKRTDAAGKARSSSSRRITLPTWPVAPTTATVRKKLPGQGAGWIDGEGGKIIYEEKLQRLFVDGKVRLPAASQPQPEADGRLLAQHAVP